MMANTSYLEGKGKDLGSRPTRAKPYLKNKQSKRRLKAGSRSSIPS
jgi:hypothetical protein